MTDTMEDAKKVAAEARTRAELKKAEAQADLAAMMANKKRFPLGSVVEMKDIASPEMVVAGYLAEDVYTVWFTDDNEFQQAGFHGDFLELSEQT